MHVVYPVAVAALLFAIGVYGVLARRNAILVLMSVELMLNAVNLNLVVFDVWLRDQLHGGQVFTLFIIVIAAAEVGIGLAIVLSVFRNRQSIDLDHLRTLTEPNDHPTPALSAPPTREGERKHMIALAALVALRTFTESDGHSAPAVSVAVVREGGAGT